MTAASSATVRQYDRIDQPPVQRPRAPIETLVLGAARIRAEVEASTRPPLPGDLKRAEEYEARANEELPTSLIEYGAGGELVPQTGERPVYLNTLEKPSYVTASASRDRLDLLQDAGALEAGLDVAETMQAANSMEMMLAHQQAVLHRASMKIAKQLNRALDRLDHTIDPRTRDVANIEATRLANMMSRMMLTYQHGATTIDRVRSGGRQQVTVYHVHQHVTVSEGGQAIVAGGAALGDEGAKAPGAKSKNG